MRNHICIVSEESVYAGRYECGVGEVVDCMAEELRNYYDVTVVTIGTGKGGAKYGTVTMGVDGDAFYEEAAKYVNALRPDLVHVFARPDFIDKLDVDCPKILSFDRWEDDVDGYLEYVPKYDHVTTLSVAYANEIIAAHPETAAWPLLGITNGISGTLYSLGRPYFSGKRNLARTWLYRRLKREDTGKKLIVNMGRLLDIKGTRNIIDDARAIAAAGAELVIWGVGDEEYEEQLQALHDEGVLVYVHRLCNYFEMVEAIRAADFYLMPSNSEVCGLMPMKAAHMGCVPIVTTVGGLGENFNETNAVIIDGTIADAVSKALALTEEEYAALHQNCIDGDWTWAKRIQPWIELYGLPTAPKEKTPPFATAASRSKTPDAVTHPSPFATKEDADG